MQIQIVNDLPPLLNPIKSKYLSFKPYLGPMTDHEVNIIDRGYYFKFYNPTTDIKLIRFFLEDNGFMEYQNSGPGGQQTNGGFHTNILLNNNFSQSNRISTSFKRHLKAPY